MADQSESLSTVYTEWLATRAPYAGSKAAAPAAWARLKVDSVLSLAADRFADNALWVLAPTADARHLALLRSASDAAAPYLQPVPLVPPVAYDASARLVVHNSSTAALVSASCVSWLSCASDSCRVHGCAAIPPAKRVSGAAANRAGVWIASNHGLFLRRWGAPKAQLVVGEASTAVAASDDLVASGSDEKLWLVDGSSGVLMRWEWVSDVATGAGGPIDDAITSLAFGTPLRHGVGGGGSSSSSPQDLYIGTPSCLNVRSGVDGTISRLGADEGMPLTNLTALVPTESGLWIGSRRGAALWAPASRLPWRYFYGARWLVGGHVQAAAVSARNGSVTFATEEGLNWLSPRAFSLAGKASHYAGVLAERHMRHGLVADCRLARFGDTAYVTQTDSDNNGLWTAIALVAAYFEYELTRSDEARARASKLFGGLRLLHEVTGVRGLMARSTCDPLEGPAGRRTCGGDASGDRRHWVNSSAPGFEGWTWKSDTSSDEVTGHIFALSVAAHLAPLAAERSDAVRLLRDTVSGIVGAGYVLRDETGVPTTWGRWDPPTVNGERDRSDGRGVSSVQMIAYLAAAMNVTQPGSADWTTLTAAYHELTNSTNGYLVNALNLKITTPTDDNFSDDELAFLPLYTALTACPADSPCASIVDRGALLAALGRTWSIVRRERSSLWGTIALAVGDESIAATDAKITSDIMWNLQTWPLELVEWPVANSWREDLRSDHSLNRFKTLDSFHDASPLPASERRQYRWNADPYDVADGGDGLTEGDPGAWLLPYWMARHHGII